MFAWHWPACDCPGPFWGQLAPSLHPLLAYSPPLPARPFCRHPNTAVAQAATALLQVSPWAHMHAYALASQQQPFPPPLEPLPSSLQSKQEAAATGAALARAGLLTQQMLSHPSLVPRQPSPHGGVLKRSYSEFADASLGGAGPYAHHFQGPGGAGSAGRHLLASAGAPASPLSGLQSCGGGIAHADPGGSALLASALRPHCAAAASSGAGGGAGSGLGEVGSVCGGGFAASMSFQAHQVSPLRR